MPDMMCQLLMLKRHVTVLRDHVAGHNLPAAFDVILNEGITLSFSHNVQRKRNKSFFFIRQRDEMTSVRVQHFNRTQVQLS